MTRRLIGIAVFVLWLAGAACGAESPLALLPKRTLGLVMVNRLAETDAHVVALGKALRTPIPSMVAVLKAQAGVIEGLDEKRSAMLVFVADEDGEAQPNTLLYLPVTDYDKFIGQMKPKKGGDSLAEVRLWGAAFLVTKVADYALFAELDHDEALKDAVAAKGLPAELAPLQDFLAANDVSIVVTRKGVETALSLARTGLGAIRGFMRGQSDEQKMLAAGIDLQLRLFEALDKETSALVAGLTIDPSGQLRLIGRVRLNPLGQWAAKVQTSGPAKLPLLAGLPDMPFAAAAGCAMPQDTGEGSWLDEMSKLSAGFIDLGEADAKKLRESLREIMPQMRGQALLLGASDGEGPLFRDLLAVIATDDANRFMADCEKQFKQQATLFEKARQAFDKVSGPGGKVAFHFVAIDPKRVLVASSSTGEQLENLVKAARDGKQALAAESSVAITSALLPENAIAMGYLSPRGAILFANRAIKTLQSIAPQGIEALPEFPAAPPVGAALTTLPGEVQLDIVVPRATTEAVGKYIEQNQPK